jgi:hypothetical protein
VLVSLALVYKNRPAVEKYIEKRIIVEDVDKYPQ